MSFKPGSTGRAVTHWRRRSAALQATSYKVDEQGAASMSRSRAADERSFTYRAQRAVDDGDGRDNHTAYRETWFQLSSAPSGITTKASALKTNPTR